MGEPKTTTRKAEAQKATDGPTPAPRSNTAVQLAGQPYDVQRRALQPGQGGYNAQAQALRPGGNLIQMNKEGEKDPNPAPGPHAADPSADALTFANPVSISVPKVANIARIKNVVSRNDVINQSYNQFDGAMTQYLGQPTISNWLTYGQHASRGVGDHLRNMEAALRTMNEAFTILNAMLSLSMGTLLRKLPDVGNILSRVYALTTAPGLIGMGVKLALQKAGISPKMLRDTAKSAVDLVSSLDWPWKKIEQAAEIAAFLTLLVGAIPGVIRALKKIFKNLSIGNRAIYQAMAPVYSSFLNAANSASNGVPGKMTFSAKVDGKSVDPNGLLSAGFELYGKVKALSDKAASPLNATESGKALAERQSLAHRANMMIVTQEQVGAQPLFDQMKAEFGAIGEGEIGLPKGQVFTMVRGNWADFATRMGYNPSRVRDPNKITPADFEGPNSLLSSKPKKGTIQDLFLSNLTDTKVVHNAPSRISPMK